LDTGERGELDALVRAPLCELTGAEDALVVNNNAGAVLLALRALAGGKPAAVSRGQLVEIGGSFRLPDVIKAGGVTLMPVGTTNVTRLGNYRDALDAGAALIVLAHQSNFYFRGRYEEPAVEDVVTLAARYGRPVLYDLGGGLLSPALFGDVVAENEPAVDSLVDAGVDVVCFSGDKLLGGPQAGIAVGRGAALAAMRRDPFYRALRCAKETFALLGACLDVYAAGRDELGALPTYRLMTRSGSELRAMAEKAGEYFAAAHVPGLTVGLADESAVTGGGTLPDVRLPTVVVALRHEKITPHALSAALRKTDPPVLARAVGDAVYLDMRSVLESDLPALARAARGLAAVLPAGGT